MGAAAAAPAMFAAMALALRQQAMMYPTFGKAAFDEVVMNTYARQPIAMERGKGCHLWDTDGNRYLDFAAGIATASLGHAHPALVAAVSDQMSRVTHVSNLYYIPEQGDLARELLDRTPGMDKAFFCNSGAEANEAAIKLARKHARTTRGVERPVVLSAENSFHGRTLATIAATGQAKYQEPFRPMPEGFEHTPYNDVDALRASVARFPDSLAAILLEPLQGEGGITPGKREFFEEARRLCDECGALLIFDEVQTGIGRTGRFWAHEHLGVTPDVITCAKALGGGVPIGAMMCAAHANVFSPGDHATTFGGNFLACAAGLAVLSTLQEEKLVANAEARGAQLEERLAAIDGPIADVRGWGLIRGVQIAANAGVTAADVCSIAAAKGLLLVPAGPSVVRFVPPLVVTSDEVDQAADVFAECLSEVAAKA